MSDLNTIEPMTFVGGPFDGLQVTECEVMPGDDIIELQDLDRPLVSIYRRQGDSRTYKFIGQDTREA